MRTPKTSPLALSITLSALALPLWAFSEPAAPKAAFEAVGVAVDAPEFPSAGALSLKDLGAAQAEVSERLQAAQRARRAREVGLYGKHRWLPMDKSQIYVLDGDTIYYGDKDSANKLKIRLLGIDAPEVAHFGAGKFEGQPFGKEATALARDIIRRADKIKYLTAGLDKYGRTLAYILADDRLLSIAMLENGFAYETITRYGNNGLPDIAGDVLAAAKAFRGRRRAFEDPHDFRHREWDEEKEEQELRRDMRRKRTPMDKSLIGFDDGDTIVYKGTTFRIAGMDTPEIIHKHEGIMKDQPYGRKAAALTEKLISKADKVEYLEGGKDKYGRTLAHVFLDGELLSVLVIKQSLAYELTSKFGPGGFPGLARVILKTFRSAPPPKFEHPLYWRAKNQRRRD